MKKNLAFSIIASIMIFSGCGTTGDDNNATDPNLAILDEDKPMIFLEKNPETGSIDIELALGTDPSNIPEYGYSAEDMVDGIISDNVKRSNDINVNRVGTYTVTYFVEDTDGFSDTKTRRVTVVDANNNNSSDGDPYDNYNTDYSNDSSTDNPHTVGGFDLGTPVGGGETTQNNGNTWAEGTGSSIDSFKNWYGSVCGQTFNASLYNATTGKYSGTITCSNRSLQTINLNELSIFSTINGLDLSYNQLTDIDFSQLGLNQLTNNMKILVSLNLKNNNLNTQDFNLFRPLHYLKNIDQLNIGGNNFNYTCDDLYKLRTEILNNRSLTIDREVEQSCPSLTN